MIVPHLRLLPNPSSYISGYSTAHQGQPGTTKALEILGLVLVRAATFMQEARSHTTHWKSSRPSLNSSKHSGYLCWKKGEFQFSVSSRLPCSWATFPNTGPKSCEGVHTPSLLFSQAGYFLPVYGTRMMLNLIPLTVFSSQFLPEKVPLTSWTGLMPPSPCNTWAAHPVSQTSSSGWPELLLKANFSSVCFPTKRNPLENVFCTACPTTLTLSPSSMSQIFSSVEGL